jgi:2-oxoglutarate dehydrogenase E1 component
MTDYTDCKASSAFEGENAAYLESLYEQYISDPSALSPEWQAYFAKHFSGVEHAPSHSAVRAYFLNLPKQSAAIISDSGLLEQEKIAALIQAYRKFGHLQANIDPLGLMTQAPVEALTPGFYGLSETDARSYALSDFAALKQATVAEVIAQCQKIYCGAIGFEYQHLDNPVEIAWLQKHIEQFATWRITPDDQLDLLKQLTATEGLEKIFGTKYVGVTRFSVEGGDTQIPLLNYLIQHAPQTGIKEVVVGMAHRGRLNVLINVLGMPIRDILAQFEGTYAYTEGRASDVKYHFGFSADLKTNYGVVHASLGFNPSHLEIISPVIQGSVRARQDRRHDTAHAQVLPIQFHGDSAFAGQGVVMETFEMSQIRGFKVGGSVHIVVNNQVGFTTSNPNDTRSSRYCTDVAKIVSAPIFHVNGDHPEAVLFVAQLVLAYHQAFKKDVVIDLVCYRRFGHNEGDEPSATQPLMYQKIKKLPSVRMLYAEQLIAQNVLTVAQRDEMMVTYRKQMDDHMILLEQAANPDYLQYQPDWTRYEHTVWTEPAATNLSKADYEALVPKITALPDGFTLQAQVARILTTRVAAYAGKTPLIWGDAEMLAYASLLQEGYLVRLVGQDSGRGTFAHRHAVVYDQNTGAPYIALQHLSSQQAAFTVVDSFLSENAVMAFEFGYASTEPRSLVLWEAQYGDFVNGAQVVIDQFLSSSEQKWDRYCGLVLLLPHGQEGAGPEHTSARLERFLQLCAQENMQVCVPTTPAQMFHLLRRQVLRPYRKPLVVLTPKGLLRKATSDVTEILTGQFEVVLDDAHASEKVKRVILCSGRVYYDLQEKRAALQQEDVAIVRIEQLYPFPHEQVAAVLKKYKKTQDIIWCQEEPKNQGSWLFIRAYLEACLHSKQTLTYIGRDEAASTAAGYKKLHVAQQAKLLADAFA